ncbi:heparinase II/III family protein [Streptomyces sp. NPDC097595]|uniref:heparinase II/III domain-containing protein n=1 Tax=Streptomyces sp. NPDC097595 TaxID=3366090 RepID=UPI0037F29E60
MADHASVETAPPPARPDSVTAWDAAAARLPRRCASEVRALLVSAPSEWFLFPRAEDRASWDAVAKRLGPAATALTEAAREAAGRPVPHLTSSLWRAFLRTGERLPYENPWYERRDMLADLLVGYCLRPTDEVLDALVDVVWMICEETSWSFPAHEPTEFPDPGDPVVDLFSALTAVGLAETLAVLGDALPGPVADRIRTEADRRVITPYLENDAWRWLYGTADTGVSNWTAVCGLGAAGAACYLEQDADRLARILAKAARSMEDYLGTFDPDGGTSEGVGYWMFGFGSFCQLADLVERRTGGSWNWFKTPVVADIARFPLRSRLTAASWVTFSDVDSRTDFPGWLLHDLGTRFGEEGLNDLGSGPSATWTWKRTNSAATTALRSVLSEGRRAGVRPYPPVRRSDWFRGIQWLITRADPDDPDALTAAVKGGRNDELHNQNDLGSLIVRAGGEDLVVDPGAGLYTRDYFNEHRYEQFVNSSRGHSVPRPAGAEQEAGSAHTAHVLAVRQSEEYDEVAYDLTAAYPTEAETALKALHRTLKLQRGPEPFIRLTDSFTFDSPRTAETAFTTYAAVEITPGHVVLRGEQAVLTIELPDRPDVDVHVDTEEFAPRFGEPRLARRVVVRTREPLRDCALAFTLRPGSA